MDTLDPLNKKGNQGLLEEFTPFGVATSVNHAVLIDDVVELVSKNRCPECGYEGDTFLVQGRIKDKERLGYASILEWI
ncbi:MAG: hypothetical protein ACFFA6_12895 [Promethearchaeota archaeon]